MRIQINDEDAYRLADKLANDDDFRAALKANPGAVLAEFGIELEPGDDRKVRKLPSKTRVREAIRAVQKATEDEVQGGHDMLAFLFSVFPPVEKPPARSARKKKK
jgi:putative modified peptide